MFSFVHTTSTNATFFKEIVKLLEKGKTKQVLSTITNSDSSTYENNAQLQVVLSIAAIDQHKYHLAVNASTAALRLSKSSPSMAIAARPVLGAALLNLGLWKLAARQLSKCLKGQYRFQTSMDTVRHLARAQGALKQHKMVARDLLKYCNARFSKNRKGYDRNKDNKFECYSIVGKQFSLARSQHQANQAYGVALSSKSKSFQDMFQKNAMDAFVQSDSNGNGNDIHQLPKEVYLPEGKRDLHVLVNTPDFMLFTIDNVLNDNEIKQLKIGMSSVKSKKNIDSLVCVGNTHPLRKSFMDAVYDPSNDGNKKYGDSSWRSSMAIHSNVNHIRYTKDGKICTNSSLLPPIISEKLRWSTSTFVSGSKYQWLELKLETMLPWLDPRNSYPTQLLEYSSGTDYSKHVDCSYNLDPNDRAFTILIYLDNPTTDDNTGGGGGGGGGETIFPRIKKGSIRVKPIPGRLVGFTSLTSKGYCNYKSEHYSNEIQKNVINKKMVVQKWYARVKQREKKIGTNTLGASFLKSMFDKNILNKNQGFISCDGSGSCREFFEYDTKKDTIQNDEL
jgi:hypothetical protein